MKIVEVCWNDAWATTDEITEEKAKSAKPVLTKTISYLVTDNEDGLVLATDIYPDDPKIGKMINFIPWEMIVKWEYLI